MSGEHHSADAAEAPVHGGTDGTGDTVGGPDAPVLSVAKREALLARNNAAHHIIQYQQTDEAERWELLRAVVWPDSLLLEEMGDAA